MIPIYQHGGLWSAATSTGIIAYGVSREELDQRLTDAGLIGVEVDAVTWRATFASATARELEALDAAVSTMANVEDVTELRSRFDLLHDRQTELNRQIQVADLRVEISRTEMEMDRQVPLTMQLLGPRAERWEALAIIRNGPLGNRLQALHAEIQGLMR